MRSKPSKLAAVALLGAAVAGAGTGLSGCILGEDSDPPVLSVDLYWEDQSRNSDDTCESADVASMDWQLVDTEGNVVEEKEGECQDGFNFFGVDPGSYTLKVNGYDGDQTKQWEGSCRLTLDRFNRAYPCDVGLASTPSDTSSSS